MQTIVRLEHPLNRYAPQFVVAATLLAAVLRFFMLDVLPPAAQYDELWIANRAQDLLVDWQWHPAFAVDGLEASGASGPSYLTVIVQLLGYRTLVSPRIVVAVAGTLSIPLTYACFQLLLRDAFTRRAQMIATLAALVLAYLSKHVVVSRIGFEPGLATAPLLFSVWQLLRGIKLRAHSGWMLSGLVAGLAQYNGLHPRFIAPLLVILVIQALISAQPTERRRIILWAGLAGLVATLVVVPLIIFAIQQPASFFARANVVSASSSLASLPTSFLQIILRAIWRTFVTLSFRGTTGALYGAPLQPILDVVQSIGFWIGLAWSVWHVRRSAAARAILVWLAVMLNPAVLTGGAQVGRMVSALPVMAALVALGWMLAFTWLANQANVRYTQRMLPIAAVALLIASIGWNAYSVFVKWPQAPNLTQHFRTRQVLLAQDIVRRAQTEPVFAERPPEAPEVVAFGFLFHETPIVRLDFRECLPLPHERATRTIFVSRYDYNPDSEQRLLEIYPQAEFTHPPRLLPSNLVSIIEVPAGAKLPQQGDPASANFASGISLYGVEVPGGPVASGDTLNITLYWEVSQTLDANLTRFMHVGTGFDESEPLVAQRDSLPCNGAYPTSLWQAGEVVPDTFTLGIPPDAPPGEYSVSVGWYEPSTLERLPLLDAGEALPDNRAVVAMLRIGQ